MPNRHILMNPFYIGNDIFPFPRYLGGPGQKDTIYLEAATQSWKAGDLIYKDDANNMKICGDTTGVQDTVIGGQAEAAAAQVTGAKTYFRVIRPTDRFIMNIWHSTVTLAISAHAQIDRVYGIFHGSSRWMVDIETAGESATVAKGRVKVIGFPTWHPLLNVPVAIGDEYGLVEVMFIAETRSTDAGSDPAPVRVLQFA